MFELDPGEDITLLESGFTFTPLMSKLGRKHVRPLGIEADQLGRPTSPFRETPAALTLFWSGRR